MKKYFLFTILFLTFSSSNAQAIEIIDAIAGTLLPKVTESVKTIIGNNVKPKKQEKAKQEVESAIKESQKSLLSDLSKEITNIENVNSVHTVSRRMIVQIGALDLLSNRNLLISLSDATSVRKEYSLQFVKNLNDILEDRGKLDNIQVTTFNPLLRNELKAAKEDMDDALGSLKTNLAFSGKALTFNTENVDSYISAIDRSADDIDDLRESAEDISRLIESYLESYTGSFNKLKSEILND